MGQGRSLTGGSADNDGVGSAGDLLLNQFSEFFVIHFLCFGHRCDNCNSCTFKNRHSLFLLYVVSDKTIRNQSPELISHGKFHFPFKKRGASSQIRSPPNSHIRSIYDQIALHLSMTVADFFNLRPGAYRFSAGCPSAFFPFPLLLLLLRHPKRYS